MGVGYNTGDMRPPRKRASADHHYNRILHEYLQGVSEEAALTRKPSDRSNIRSAMAVFAFQGAKLAFD